MMKFLYYPAFLPVLALLLSSCATSTVKQTYVATTTTEPRSIYVQPFAIADSEFIGGHGASAGELGIRKAIAPMEFAYALRNELGKIAPATVLKPGEAAPGGWLVHGEFQLVDAGSKVARGMVPHNAFGAGRSTLVVHVKVTDVSTGSLLYAFDVSGGSGLTGMKGNTGAPGVGPASAFDFKNAAQRITLALSKDPMRFGARSDNGFW